MENIQRQLLGEIWENAQGANENFEIEMDDEDDRDADGTLDGGVAMPDGGGSNSKRKSSDCDLILYLSCEEVLDIAPSHSILRPGVVVSIGLDKNTKLSAVFNRYVDFCNESGNDRISVGNLEFVHCHVLDGEETAEASALMKNDKIHVRKVRTVERKAEAERNKILRDADRTFFQDLRHLMPQNGVSKTADVILDCQGKLLDTSGRNQQVLRTTVRAHAPILSKRCPWLGAIIQKARAEFASANIVEDSNSRDDDEPTRIRRVESEKSENIDDEDDGIEVLNYSPKGEREATGATEIENDEEEDQPFNDPREVEDARATFPVFVADRQAHFGRNLLWVTLPDHSPEAVKLLLEYCYTNRVLSLGQEAFFQACKTKPTKSQGPVVSRPKIGHPNVSFSVALAGISLAEEAGMHRLSLMCEVAASLLLNPPNVVEALSICTSQKSISGNELPRLRKAAMDIVLRSGSRGVAELGRMPAFRRALDERRSVIVPTLLKGTMEAVTSYNHSRGIKRDRSHVSYPTFEEVDRQDSYERERERRKRRQERWKKDPMRRAELDLDEDFDELYGHTGWAAETVKQSLRRMSHHLDMTQRAIDMTQRVVLSRSGVFPYQTSSRRSSNRRRSNPGDRKSVV